MNRSLGRDSDGRMRVGGDAKAERNRKARVLTMALTIGVAAIVLTGVGFALAEGDKNRFTHGEDDGYYDENNSNPFSDEPFPGEDVQNRTGM